MNTSGNYNENEKNIDEKTPHILFSKIPKYMGIALGSTATGNMRRVAALGNNMTIDTGTVPEDIWPNGGIYPFLAAASALEILSSSTLDTSAGTGARTVLVNGLDGNYDEVSQTITMNGTTAVSIPTNLLRINSIFIMSAGSTEINQGTITVRDVATSTARSVIPIGAGFSRQAVYTVPNGYTLSIISLFFSINRTISTKDNIEATLHIRSNNGFYREPLLLGIDSRNSPYRHDGDPGIVIAQKNDITLRCTYVENSGTNVTGAFLGTLTENSLIPNITY